MKCWKKDSDGKTALLIEGARRIGKLTVAEEFAKNEYESYILIDFSKVSKDIRALFEDVSDLNYLFLQLQLQYKTDLHERKSVIIFDEVQLFMEGYVDSWEWRVPCYIRLQMPQCQLVEKIY